MKVGDIVQVNYIRSNHCDKKKGIGWYVSGKINVIVDRVNDLTFCFWFNGEFHYELQDECRPSVIKTYIPEKELAKVKYSKDSFEYRLKVEYDID